MTEHAQRRLWTPDFVMATFVNLFISIVFYLLMTSMALYAVDRFAASDSAAGFAASSYILGALVARLFAGQLIVAVGAKAVLVASLAAFAVFGFLYLPSGSLAVLLAVRLLHGMAFGLANTAVSATAQALIPPARRGEGTGYFSLSGTLATAGGPFLAVLLAGSGDYESIFWFSTASAAAACLLSLLLRIPRRPAAERPRMREVAWLRPSSMVERAAFPMAAMILLAGASYSVVLSFLAAHVQASGGGATAAVFFTAYAVSTLIGRLFAGRLQDRRGDNVVMYPGLVIMTASMLLLVLPPTTAVLTASGILCGLGFGIVMPCGQAIAVAVAPEPRIGVSVSTFYLALDVGTAAGPVLLGALLGLTGYQGMYAVSAGIAVLAGVVYFALHGRHKPLPRAFAS
ncbi:MFS transporter [Zafaria sp. Z1313]|uniref:MFS transporter n=1 Tax=unclassified Zafaria TaxID=2828765 RepID=UPI002E797414|nr:MFS transporter [Zafaria sp. J156]MEE1621715.1 MFS transporter [Zafaria sp. J156]